MGRSSAKIGSTASATLARLALLACALFLLLPSQAEAGSAIGTREVDDAGVRAYWTPERMRAAEPLEAPAPGSGGTIGEGAPAGGPPTAVDPVPPGSPRPATLSAQDIGAEPTTRSHEIDRDEITDPSAEPFRSHGKVFLTITGGSAPGDYVCSGTAVASGNQSVVWSAGHCVYDTFGGGYASNWMFAPAYKDGETPFGEWTAETLAAPQEWRQDENLSYDLGAAVVGENGSGQALTELVGGRGIGFNQARSQTYEAFGYPAQQPPLEFNGEREFRCTSELGGTDDPEGSGPDTSYIPCDMTAGSSGGGWVAGDTVLSVISYSLCIGGAICDDRLYGPYQGDIAEDLYLSVAGGPAPGGGNGNGGGGGGTGGGGGGGTGGGGGGGGEPVRCAGREVTEIGTAGPDRLVGTSGPDVFKALGGADEIIGRGGRDVICAGNGRDLIKGNRGRDELRGGKGRDELRGGKGRDVCKGGKGRDSARGCESVKSAR